MRKRHTVLAAALLISLPLLADGAGFYLPDSPSYITAGGEEYSWTEPACASDIYPVDSILTLTDRDTGESYSIHVNDMRELPPDRDIVLNAAAAAATGIDRTGYRSGDIEVVYSEGGRTLKDGGWWAFDVATAESNREAMDIMAILRANNMRPFPEVSGSGITVRVRWIPSYQKESVGAALKALGFGEYSMSQDENPYL